MHQRVQDLNALAPKKPNWDLKRDLEKKLEKLERRTQNAISDLIRMLFLMNSRKYLMTFLSLGNRLKEQQDISNAAEPSSHKLLVEEEED